MNRVQNTKRNIISGTLNKVALLMFPFILRVVIIHILGTLYSGLSGLFTSIMQVLNLSELGMGSTIIFSLYKPISIKDNKLICAIMNFLRKAYCVIGVVIFVVGFFAVFFIEKLIKGDCPSDVDIHIIYVLFLANLSLGYMVFGYFSAVFTAFQRIDVVNNTNTIIRVVSYMLEIGLLYITKSYYIIIVIDLFATLANNIILKYRFKKIFPDIMCVGEITYTLKKDIIKKIKGIMVSRICAVSRNAIDAIFISSFIGLGFVTMYDNYYLVISSLTGFFIVIINSITPGAGNSVALESKEKNYRDFKVFDFLYTWIASVAAIMLVGLYQPFIGLFFGKEFVFDNGIMLLFCLYFFLMRLSDVIGIYGDANGLYYEQRVRAIVETLLNIILNYALGKAFGVVGILLATIITIYFLSYLWGSWIIYKNYFDEYTPIKMYKSHLIRLVLLVFIGIATVGTFSFLEDILSIESQVIRLMERTIICLVLSNAMLYIFYRRTDDYRMSKKWVLANILHKQVG